MTTNSALPSLVTLTAESTTLCIVYGFDSMPVDQAARLLRRLGSPSALRRRRLDERDSAICDLVAHYDLASGRQLAEAVHRDLVRYAASGHRVNTAPPADAKRALLHQILDLIGGGKIPGAEQIREILAGKRS
jgi:hypothetical protein